MNERQRLILIKLALWEESMSQADVCRKTGIDPAVLSMIIHGKYLPDEKQKLKIAAAIGRPADELFTEQKG